MIGRTALCKETLVTIAIVLFVYGAGISQEASDDQVPPETSRQEKLDEAFSDALEAIALLPTDVSFRNDYTEIDSFRLWIVDQLMADPMKVPAYCESLAVWACGDHVTRMLQRAEQDLSPTNTTVDPRKRVRSSSDPIKWDLFTLDVENALSGEGFSQLKDEVNKLDDGLEDAVLVAAGSLWLANKHLAVAYEPATASEIEFIRETIELMLLEDEFDPTIPIQEKERKTKKEEEDAKRLLEIAPSLQLSHVFTASEMVALADHIAKEQIRNSPKPSGANKIETTMATGDVIFAVEESPVGPIIVGGYGETIYIEDAAIIIDLGGDDIYLNNAGGATENIPAAIVIDLQGDDIYRCGDYSIGSGFFGVGMLSDMQGDDSYEAGNFSIGSGVFGVGILIDEQGNDTYYGDTTTEGAGSFGIGILKDIEGNDSYTGRFFCQAFASVKGFGLLADHEGNDYYFAGGKYTDELRYFDHYLSLSQGFAIGWRPEASGGIALLADGSGNDVYVSDIFGQGSSYWFSVAGLVDFQGNDNYVSYQYAQGAGTHLTVAALVDKEGDDNYNSKGVSQGCGHDLAAGILYDYSGDDNYTCHDLSQAAGNANGFGLLVDFDGNDSYSVRSSKNTHGYGNFRRDYGSIGVFLDLAGEDSYSGDGKNGGFWTQSKYGVGLDREEVE